MAETADTAAPSPPDRHIARGRPLRLRLATFRERLRGSLWFIPAAGVLLASALAFLTLRLDGGGTTAGWLGFSGSAASARSILSAIASSIITLTALVFSVTVVALQLASSQYSPRVLRSFLRDRRSQVVLASFLATFAYTMLVLRAVRGGDGVSGQFVPELSVHVALGMTALSLGYFVFFIHHIASTMQSSTIVANVAAETAGAVLRLYPTAGADLESGADTDIDPGGGTDGDGYRRGAAGRIRIPSAESGYLQTVDEGHLLEIAEEHDLLIEVAPRPGDFVPRGGALCFVEGDAPADLGDRLPGMVQLGRQRTMQQDPAFGFRQLVDIAAKGLSPGVNDPTTAVQALDRLYELLLLLAPRQLPAAVRAGEDGRARLVLPHPSWESYVRLTFDEIRQYGEGSIQVTRRLAVVLDDLLAVVPPARRGPLEEQQRLLERAARRGFADAEDVDHATAS